MNINNNFTHQNTHPSFGAIKIVKCNNQEAQMLLNRCSGVLSLQKHEIFKGKSPLHSDLVSIISQQAERMGYSQDWIIKNAQVHGIKVPKTDSAPFFDITGKDLLKFYKMRLKNICNMFCFNIKHKNNPEVQALPKHLRWIKVFSDFADKEQCGFDKFLKKNNAVEMDINNYISSLVTDQIFNI